MNDSGIKHYLAQLNNEPLLTRQEETALLKNIEAKQFNILSSCVYSKVFRAELLEVLKNENIKDIDKISRNLDRFATKKQRKDVEKGFLSLVEALEKGKPKRTVQKYLKKVMLSGTIVYTLVTQLKRKYAYIESYEHKVRELRTYFGAVHRTSLEKKLRDIQEDPAALEYYARKLNTTESQVLSKAYEYKEELESLGKLTKLGVSPDQFRELSVLYKAVVRAERGMKASRDELIRKNLRLVVSRAKRHVNRGLSLEDLIQEGNIGLIKAINKHDSSRGTKVSTYATWWIDQTIRRAISNKSKTVRIPTHVEYFQVQLTAAYKELTNELDRAPTREELAAKLSVSTDLLEKLENTAMHEMGIEEELSSGMSLLETLPSDPAQNPYNVAAKKLLREKVREILGTLKPRTEKIIRLRYGIGEPEEFMTLREIAKLVRLSAQGVKVVQGEGFDKIKKYPELAEDPE